MLLNVKHIILTHFICAYVMSAFFLFRESDNNIVDSTNKLKLSISLLVICLIYLFLSFYKPVQKTGSLNCMDFIVFFVSVCILSSIKNILNNEISLNLFFLIVLYCTIRIIYDSSSNTLENIFFLALIYYLLFRLTLPYLVQNGFIPNNNSILAFNNSGKEAIFLAILLSININSLYQFINSNNRYKISLSILVLLSAFFVILSVKSRAGLCCYFSSVIYLLSYPIKNSKWKKGFLSISWLIISAVIFSFVFKQQSASGRMLIWKISLLNSDKYAPSGVKNSSFKANYLEWQSDYFKKGNYTENELYLAGDTYYAFNEPLQFLIEYGIAPFLILFIMFIFTFMKLESDGSELFYIVLAFSSSVFYTFHVNAINLLVMCVSASVKCPDLIKINMSICKYGYPLIKLTVVSIIIGVVFFSIQTISTNNCWQQARYIKPFDESRSLEKYESVANKLNENGEFMLEFAVQLTSILNYQKALFLTKKSMTFITTQSSFLNLGICCDSLGYIDAERYYIQAKYAIPSRDIPRYCLFNFYLRRKDSSSARLEAQSLLAIKPKNPDNIISQEIRKNIISFEHSSNH